MYKLNANGNSVQRLADNACIPIDDLNIDCQVYLSWIAEGNEPEAPDSPSKEGRIAALQTDYDSGLDKLNKAWLAALIADGTGEAARQAIIKSQMDALEAQLEVDILNILMEE